MCNFDVLLKKVECLGFDESAVCWIKDYLRDRQQKVVANNHTSRLLIVKQGVPQGSILGPLLYLIYANDIHQIFKKCGFVFYADDTVLYSTYTTFELARKNMQKNLNALTKWCSTNGIYMNVDKTKCMVFGNKYTLTKVKKFELKVNGKPIKQVASYNYLGILLDPGLTFERHVNQIVSKVSNKVSQLRRMRKFLNVDAAVLVYKNMILPILEYGDVFLTAASKDNRDKLQILQNKALRVALQVDKYYDTDLLHTEAKLSKLKQRRKFHLLLQIYDQRNLKFGKGEEYPHGIRTRSKKKNNFYLRKPNTEKYKKCASYVGRKNWNALPGKLQKLNLKPQFKAQLSKLLGIGA